MRGAFPARAAPLRRRTALMRLPVITSTVPRTCLSGQAARGDGVTVNAGCATSPLPNTTRRDVPCLFPLSHEMRDGGERDRGACVSSIVRQDGRDRPSVSMLVLPRYLAVFDVRG